MTREEFQREILPINKRLFATAFRLLRNREEAEDAVQEVFIKLWNMRDKLTDYKSPLALATTMTRNQSLDRLRKHKPALIEDGGMEEIDRSGKSPQAILENSESLILINSIIDRLPDKHKEAITMHDIDGFSYQEISEMTGTNLATLRVNLSRARESVREQLNKLNYERK